jgi:NAD(P)-dependent dehydrogenase (short-subunit alcohol dehydrogenase family)
VNVNELHVMVNNAGVSRTMHRSFLDDDLADFRRVMGVNVLGVLAGTRHAARHMATAGGGSIINVSSAGSLRPAPDMLPYAAAKAGLNALTEGFAKAFGPTVRVNTLMAGPFLTDISKAWNLDKATVNPFTHLSLKRAGNPPEIVGAALYLMSDASSYTTGTILRVDGGIP